MLSGRMITLHGSEILFSSTEFDLLWYGRIRIAMHSIHTEFISIVVNVKHY
jgi:hypothetical protein